MVKLRFGPNLVTMLALVTGVMVAPALCWQANILALLLLLLSGLFDGLDGSVARFSNKCSDYGTVLDIVADRVVEFSIILGLFLVAPADRALLCIFMLGSTLVCVTSFLVVGVFSENNTNKNFYYSPGLIERFEAFGFFALMIVFPKAFGVLAVVYTVLVAITTINRIQEFANLSAPPIRHTAA